MNARMLPSLLVLACIGGCVPSPSPQAPVATGKVAESRVLCLAERAGVGPVESALRARQRDARASPGQAERWSAAGREWVRVARWSGDPGFHHNVEACAAEALALDQDHVPALELRALRLMSDHRFEEARALALEVVARDPDSMIGYGTLSDALLELGRYDESAEAAQRQARIRPSMGASARGAYLRWLRGDVRGARLLIRDALVGRDPGDPEPAAWVLAEAAALYWHEGDRDGADALYGQALEWFPAQQAALLGRARIALARGDARSALAFLDEAERLRPSLESAWLRGEAHEQAGERDLAARAFDDAVRLGRRGDGMGLALFLATRNRDAGEALAAIETEARTRAGVYVDDVRAWALYRAGRVDDALAAITRAAAHGTRDARVLYHAGAIRIAAGDEAEGRKLVAAALRLNPDFDPTGAREARALLDGASA